MKLHIKKRKIHPYIGERSSLPPSFPKGDDYVMPVQLGNYFEFVEGGYCINMWLENVRRFKMYYSVRTKMRLADLKVRVFDLRDEQKWRPVKRLCQVIDRRVPKKYLNVEPCFTGVVGVPRVMYEKMLRKMRWPTTRYICGCEGKWDSPSINEWYECGAAGKPGFGHAQCLLCGRQWVT